MLKTISPRAREMLRLRFAEDMTEAETVALSSQMQVSGILREAVARLRWVAEQQRLGCG